MPPSLLDALVAGTPRRCRPAASSRAPWACSTASPPRRADRRVGRSRRPARPAGAAGHRRRRAIAIGGGRGARLRRPRSGGADRRRGAEPRRQRAASCGWCADAIAAARHSRARRHSARCGAGAARAPSRPGAGRRARDLAARLERLADMAEHHLDLDAIKQLAVPLAPLGRAARAAGCRRRASASRWRTTTPSASSIRMCWTAGAARAPRSCPSRRSPTRPRRSDCDSCWLPGGYPELHAGRAGRRRSVPRRPDAVRRDAAGAWRVRRLHGARREPRGRRRRQPPHGRAARPCHQLRAAQAASRLSPGAAARRLPAWDRRGRSLRGHEFHYAAVDRARPATSRWPSLPTARAKSSARSADGAGNVTGTFFHAIAKG